MTGLQSLQSLDLNEKTIIITGSNCGIGFETARSLALHGALVIMACRDIEKARKAIDEIKHEEPQIKAEALHLDLASLRSVKEFATTFKKNYTRLDVLILNAGMTAPNYILTEDGCEMTIQVNYLGHFYLTELLEDVLIQSAPSRVVVVSSVLHKYSTLNVNNISAKLFSPPVSRYRPSFAYIISKFCCILFANELNRRLTDKKVFANSLHPGMIRTNITRSWWFYRLFFFLMQPFTKSLQQGAATCVYCAVSPELEGVGGKYFENCCQSRPIEAAEDELLAKKLWALSKEAVARALEKKPNSPNN